MLENFIYAKQKSLFEEALNNGLVLDEAIVFIEDTKEIWNHGTYFDGSKSIDLVDTEDVADDPVVNNYITSTQLENKLLNKQDTISDLETIRSGAALGATALQEEQYKGTVTSITAGDGLTGGTITESGTIALEESGVTAKKYPSNTATWTTDTFVDGSAYNVKRIVNMTGSITVDKYGRITNATFYNNGVNIYYPKPVTTSLNGLMTASDKTKLDGIDMTKKQDTLVSGTNIKTINGESILGEGNIVIEGGSGGSSSGGSCAYALVEHGTSDTTFTLTPNTFHVWDEVATLDLSFGAETSGVANEYLFQFTSGATATTLTLPDDIKWANEPTIAENMIYQISVLKGLASVLEFSNAPEVVIINFYVSGLMFEAEEGMTWADVVGSEYNTYNELGIKSFSNTDGIIKFYSNSGMSGNLKDANSRDILETDVVISNHEYTYNVSGGGYD